MKTSALTLALAATVSASVIVERDASTVISDISGISSQVSGLTSALNSFSSINDAPALIAAESKLDAAIQQGASDAKAVGTVTTDQVNQILTAVAGLIPGVVGALNAAVSKFPTFTSLGLSTVLVNDLNSLKTDTDSFAAALVAAAPSAAQGAASAAVSCIDAAFASALATKSADGSCASLITTIGGGSSPASTTGSSTPSSTGSSSAATTAATKTTASGAASGTGVASTTTGVTQFTGAANALNAGVFGAVVAAGVALAL